MSLNVVRTKSNPWRRIVICGPPGVGKSSWALGVDLQTRRPRSTALALDYESGLGDIPEVARVAPADTWEASLKLAEQACTEPGAWDAVVIDTADKLEDQASEMICKRGIKGKPVQSLADFGYGDGYEALAAEWRRLLFALEGARENRRHVILVCHIQQKTQTDPTVPVNFDKWVPALAKRSWGATHRWADEVLFAQYERGVSDKGRVVATGVRELRTIAGGGYDAKNRLNLPDPMPLEWAAYARYLRTPEVVRESIRSLATGEDLAKAETYLAAAGDDVARLCSIETALIRKKTEKST